MVDWDGQVVALKELRMQQRGYLQSLQQQQQVKQEIRNQERNWQEEQEALRIEKRRKRQKEDEEDRQHKLQFEEEDRQRKRQIEQEEEALRLERRRKRQEEDEEDLQAKRAKLEEEREDRRRKLQIENEDRQRKLQIEEENRQRKDRSKNRFVWEIVDTVCKQSLSNEDAIRAAMQMLVDRNDIQRMQTATTMNSGDRRMIKQFRMVMERLMINYRITPALAQMANGELRTEHKTWCSVKEILFGGPVTKRAEADNTIASVVEQAAAAPAFADCLDEFRRVLVVPRGRGGGCVAAMSIFLSRLSELNPGTAEDYIHSLIRQRCFQVKDLQLSGRGRAVQWYNSHPTVEKVVAIAKQLKQDAVTTTRTFSLAGLQEAFVKARFLVSAARQEGALRVEEWCWPGSEPPQDVESLRTAVCHMLRNLTVVYADFGPCVDFVPALQHAPAKLWTDVLSSLRFQQLENLGNETRLGCGRLRVAGNGWSHSRTPVKKLCFGRVGDTMDMYLVPARWYIPKVDDYEHMVQIVYNGGVYQRWALGYYRYYPMMRGHHEPISFSRFASMHADDNNYALVRGVDLEPISLSSFIESEAMQKLLDLRQMRDGKQEMNNNKIITTNTGWEMMVWTDRQQGLHTVVRMGPATPPLVVWLPTENEVLSPLEGQLDMVADGPRNVPANASTLWELLQYWCPLLRRRVGVTEQEVLCTLQGDIDRRWREDKPILRLNVTWFDVRANHWRTLVPSKDEKRMAFIYNESPPTMGDLVSVV